MDENLYDEFGNYIGPEIKEVDEVSLDNDEEHENTNKEQNEQKITNLTNEKYGVVLHEDKNYYQASEEIYPGVETLVMEEDAQPLTEPIVPVSHKKEYDHLESKIPETTFDFDFMAALMTKPELIRNIALAGNLHHGKTQLLDLFIQNTHLRDWDINKEYRYTDCRQDEQIRGISVKAKPISLILQNKNKKSLLMNIMDTPGHPNFSDEVSASYRLVDGVIIVVDVVEGIMHYTEKLITAAIKESLDIVLCINKIDRLVLELKLPTNDAYYKIKYIVDEFNGIVTSSMQYANPNNKKSWFVSPEAGNVIFSSSTYGIVFTLESFAIKYNELHNEAVDVDVFSKLLWGDVFYNPETNKFLKKCPNNLSLQRSFVDFILEPMYKIMGYAVSEDKLVLEKILSKVGIYLKNTDYKMDPKPLLKLVCQKFLGHLHCLVDVVFNKVINSEEGSKIKINQYYSGDRTSDVFTNISKCSSSGVLCLNVLKLYHKYDYLTFDSFGRVLSGTIKKGDHVKVLGEKYNIKEQEDMIVKEVTNMYIFQSRYRVEISKVPAGNWVLLEGIDLSISKSATVSHSKENMLLEVLKPIDYICSPWMKVSVEPLNPSELPKMLEGLRKINKSYPGCKTKIEESGEHIIHGTGELYMDCILHDLRKLYSEIEIKVSDPVVNFTETVIDTSSLKCYADTSNKKSRIYMICEPLDKGLALDIEKGQINSTKSQSIVESHLMKKYKWNLLTSRSLWAFGPDGTGTNLLIDYTIPSETDKSLLFSVKDSIVQGFDWACREGPLCEEPIKNVKFKIVDAKICSESIFKAGGQIIPSTRRVCYSAFLMANPRLMEPTLITEIMCPVDCINAIYTILARRRGHVNSELPKPGTPFYIINANIPALDSFGFETDLRTHTAGQAFCLSWFDQWTVMPGDPLDRSIQLKPLEPSPPPFLARESMIKTRRRKGLLEDVTISKFFDDQLLLELVKKDTDYKQYF